MLTAGKGTTGNHEDEQKTKQNNLIFTVGMPLLELAAHGGERL